MDDNNKIIENLELTTQELTLLKSLKKFYNDKKVFETLNTIINGDNYISRRTIEYFVTNYALYNKINYNIEEKGIIYKFYVHTSYKDQLKAHKKKYFDPFGRGIRIPFFLDDMCIITTIGQLNFYRWFFSKKIYEYCLENYNIIQSSLLNCKKNIKKKKSNNNLNYVKKNKIKYDYKPKINSNHNGNIIVSFDV
jgi:hypothetical protein